MKRRIFLSAFFAVITMASAISSKPPVEETRNLSGFSKINFGVAGNLFINFGPQFKVVLEGDQSLLDNIITEVSGDKLVIKKDNWHMQMAEKLDVYITMPELNSLGISGSGKAEIRDDLKAKDLSFSVSGSGKLFTGNVEADDLECHISGSGDIIFGEKGHAEKADIGISGSGNYDGGSFEIGTASISISGSGNCTCNVKESLEAHVSGSGNVYYSGDPKVDGRVSGSGKIRSK